MVSQGPGGVGAPVMVPAPRVSCMRTLSRVASPGTTKLGALTNMLSKAALQTLPPLASCACPPMTSTAASPASIDRTTPFTRLLMSNVPPTRDRFWSAAKTIDRRR